MPFTNIACMRLDISKTRMRATWLLMIKLCIHALAIKVVLLDRCQGYYGKVCTSHSLKWGHCMHKKIPDLMVGQLQSHNLVQSYSESANSVIIPVLGICNINRVAVINRVPPTLAVQLTLCYFLLSKLPLMWPGLIWTNPDQMYSIYNILYHGL